MPPAPHVEPPPAEHSFPGAHALQLAMLLKRWDIAPEELLRGSGFSEADLEAPRARIAAATFIALTERARELTGEPGLGFYLGLQKRLSMYGYLGFATMNAATVREGIELAVRYVPTVTTGLRFELQVEGERASVRIDELIDMGPAHDVALFSLVVGLRRVMTGLTGIESPDNTTDLPIEEPHYFSRFRHLLPNARFGQPVLRLGFEARALDLPLTTPDRAAMRLACDACERELQALGFQRDLSARVCHLFASDQRVRGIEDVARALHLSSRTLKRRLAVHGLTFTELRDRDRYRRAQSLLRVPELSLDDVALRLDYSSPSNFARAFRRWSGETPAQYRHRALGPAGGTLRSSSG